MNVNLLLLNFLGSKYAKTALEYFRANQIQNPTGVCNFVPTAADDK